METSALSKASIRQIKAARALLGWSQQDLADKAGVSIPTIKRLEAVEGPLGGWKQTADKIIGALISAGIAFIDDPRRGIGVRLLPARQNQDQVARPSRRASRSDR